MQENDGKFTYEAIHSMKYLDMVVSGEKWPCSHARTNEWTNERTNE
jgi:hypothetical protein